MLTSTSYQFSQPPARQAGTSNLHVRKGAQRSFLFSLTRYRAVAVRNRCEVAKWTMVFSQKWMSWVETRLLLPPPLLCKSDWAIWPHLGSFLLCFGVRERKKKSLCLRKGMWIRSDWASVAIWLHIWRFLRKLQNDCPIENFRESQLQKEKDRLCFPVGSVFGDSKGHKWNGSSWC